jgi:hypothetical protein
MVMMRYIESKGGWSLCPGRLTIDFNLLNEMAGIDVNHHYKPPKKDAIDFEMKV